MRWLSQLLRGGTDELGWDDLVRRVTKEIASLARYGKQGRVAFPPDVCVRIEVGEGSVGLVRGFVEKPEFDREVGVGLINECDCGESDLPVREYIVDSAAKTSVRASEGSPKAWEIAIQDGDLAGRVLLVPAGRSEARFGRGQWHGADERVRNDLVVCETIEYVSRRAGRLIQSGHRLEVESLDQGDALLVRRENGEVIRPSRTAKGRVALSTGDLIELSDEKSAAIRLSLRRISVEESTDHGGADA